MLLILTLACTDYSFGDPEEVLGGDNVNAPDDTGDYDEEERDTPSFDDPPTDRPPTFLDGGDCEGNETAWFDFDEIYVKSWDQTSQTGLVSATVAGWYHIYDLGMAESGESQTNETAYVRISNATNPGGTPAWANCGQDWFVVDADNHGEPTERLYSGTFWLDEGDNTLELLHYCPNYRDGQCTTLHITDWSDGTCDSSNPNSVHLVGDGACVIAAD